AIYESVWAHDPVIDTPHLVEATEASLARVYFSALGGWGSQEAKFDNRRQTIAAYVEMGRVSELRIERVGRIGVFWNRAKHVIVYRRSVVPAIQFADRQDPHIGRPILRKVEEYVEFLEAFRRFPDAATAEQGAALPAALCGF